jgi:hypothetical protein
VPELLVDGLASLELWQALPLYFDHPVTCHAAHQVSDVATSTASKGAPSWSKHTPESADCMHHTVLGPGAMLYQVAQGGTVDATVRVVLRLVAPPPF